MDRHNAEALKHAAEKIERLPYCLSGHALRDACEEIAGELRTLARGGRIEVSKRPTSTSR